jgi:hypothetical protein
MNKNTMFKKERVSKSEGARIHPIWRGVGFVMMIFMPVLSYIGATVIMDYNKTQNWFPIPREFVISWPTDPYILMRLFITAILWFLFYAFFMLITFFLSGLFAPKRYIPPDIPPLHKKRHW